MKNFNNLILVLLVLFIGDVLAVMQQDTQITDRQQSPTKPAQARLCMVGDSIT